MKLLFSTILIIMLVFVTSVKAQEDQWSLDPIPRQSHAANSSCVISDVCGSQYSYQSAGWFGGVGGSYNSVKVDSTVSGIGRTEIYSGATLVAIGTAGGPAAPFKDTETTFAPLAQFGYFQKIDRSDWLWGTKFAYKYLGLTLSDDGFDAPQEGVYEVLNPPSTSTFLGNAVTDSAQTSVDHELALIPFLGRSFHKGHFYLGGGPVVFAAETRMYGLSSYADIAGVHTNIGGAPLNLEGSNWMWGGAAQMGMMYSFSPSCILDVSYDFMVTGEYKQTWPVDVTSSSNGLTYDTSISYQEVLQIWAQSVNVSLTLTF